jgi:hypothetical protein
MSFIREIDDRRAFAPALPDFDRYRREADRLRRAERQRIVGAALSRLGRLLSPAERPRPAARPDRAPGHWVAE